LNFSSNRLTGVVGGNYYCWELSLRDYTIDAYSFPALKITGMEADTGDSKGKIAPGYFIATNFGGEVILTTAGFLTLIPGGEIVGIIGAGVGLGVLGVAAFLDYTQGQEVSRYDQTIAEDHHRQLRSTTTMWVNPDASRKSASDLIFLGLDPTAGKTCGLTKVVLKGTLQASYWIIPYMGFPMHWDYHIGNIEITLCIPWFIWTLK